jgi:hypothetical protein
VAIHNAKFPFSGDYCQGMAALISLEGVEQETVMVDGREVEHYHLESEDVGELWGPTPTPTGSESVTMNSSPPEMDVWLDSDSYLLSMIEISGSLDLTWNVPERNRIAYDFWFKMEVLDINDPSISIEPPI